MMSTSAPLKSSSARLDAVQVFRAIAAALVVLGHSQTVVGVIAAQHHTAFVRSRLAPWGAGVDLFFVISGFIIVYASRDLFAKPGGHITFLRRRITRVAPFYWFCTLVYIAIILVAKSHGSSQDISPKALLASFIFIPYASYGVHDGIFPVFDLGWTLNYEMFFYMLFALTIGLRRHWAALATAAVLATITVWGVMSHPRVDAIQFWTKPIVLDFALGVGVAQLRDLRLRWSAFTRLLILATGATLFISDPLKVFSVAQGVTVANDLPRVLSAGVPAALMLAAAVCGPSTNWRILTPLAVVGDASYSLYLTHPFVLIFASKLMTRSAWLALIGPWPSIALILALSIALALVCERWIEDPLTSLTLRLTKPAAPREAVPPVSPLQPEGT